MPLIIIMLNIVGVLEYQTLKEKRRMIILILFVFAAFMTPGQDPFSMVVLAACLVLLVEMAIQFTRINDKKRQRERPEWMDLDDESASPLNTAPGGTDAPAPISRPAPVDAPRPTHTSGFDDVL